MEKIDFKKSLSALYNAPTDQFARIKIPAMRYVQIDGAGDPNRVPAFKHAVEWLYSTSYAMKFASKKTLSRDYVVPPLEGLWRSDHVEDFKMRRKDFWKWTVMIMTPEFIADDMFRAAVEKSEKKLGPPPASLRMETFEEGLSLQILHIGPYDDEGPTLAWLHDDVMPALGLAFNGPHHEIYLSDARKTAPAKLKTILRQPVKILA